jgi:hypothetical protein
MAPFRRRSLALPAAAALLACALALTGCGLLTKKPATTPAPPATSAAAAPTDSPSPDSSGSAEADAVPDPCTLLTDNDISVAVGQPIAKHTPSANGAIMKCNYTAEPGWVDIILARTTKEAFDSAEKIDSGSKAVDGVGDGGYSGTDTDLRVLHGTYLITIKFVGAASPRAQLTAQKAITAKLLAKLP